MDKVWGRLTVFFEKPFWVGVFERISEQLITERKNVSREQRKGSRETAAV